MKKLKAFFRYLVVTGYNSKKYDLILLIGSVGFGHYLDQLDGLISAIKVGTSYLTLRSNHLKFVDVLSYSGQAVSLRQYLRQFNVDGLQKCYFPYSSLQNKNTSIFKSVNNGFISNKFALLINMFVVHPTIITSTTFTNSFMFFQATTKVEELSAVWTGMN